MKRGFIFLLILFFICFSADAEADSLIEGLQLSDMEYALQIKDADVTGDGIIDNVILVGIKERDDSIFNHALTLYIRDGATEEYIRFPFEKSLGGYEPSLFLGDLSGDGTKDVMVTVASGGSGGIYYHRIVSFLDGIPQVIFSEANDTGLTIDGEYVDNFQAKLWVYNLEREILLDISAKADNYINDCIYSEDGILNKEVKPWSYPFSNLDPIDIDGDGVYELYGYQRIVGTCNADPISVVQSVWKYDDEEWVLIEAQYITFMVTFR